MYGLAWLGGPISDWKRPILEFRQWNAVFINSHYCGRRLHVSLIHGIYRICRSTGWKLWLLWQRKLLASLRERSVTWSFIFLAISIFLMFIYLRFFANGANSPGIVSALRGLFSERTFSAWRSAVVRCCPTEIASLIFLLILWPLSLLTKEGRDYLMRSVLCLFVLFCSFFIAALQKDYFVSHIFTSFCPRSSFSSLTTSPSFI